MTVSHTPGSLCPIPARSSSLAIPSLPNMYTFPVYCRFLFIYWAATNAVLKISSYNGQNCLNPFCTEFLKMSVHSQPDLILQMIKNDSPFAAGSCHWAHYQICYNCGIVPQAQSSLYRISVNILIKLTSAA